MKDKDKELDYVVDCLESWEEYHKDRFDEAKEFYDNWIQKPTSKKEDWMNCVRVPLTIEGEQTISPRLYAALFPTDAPLDLQVVGKASPSDGIIIRDTLRHYFRVAKVQDEAVPHIQQTTLLGTGYMEMGSWFVNKGWKPNPENPNKPDFVIKESRPKAEHIDFWEILPHPCKLRIGDGLPLIRRHWTDGEAIKALADVGKVKNLKAALDTEPPAGLSGKFGKKGKRYEVCQYWGNWDQSLLEDSVTTERLIPYWIIVINRKVVIRSIPNPYNHQREPYTKSILFPDITPSWFGVGVGKIGKSSQDRCDKIVNQRLDNVDLVINKERVYNGNDPHINENKLKSSKPGQNHKASDVNNIRYIETADVTSSSYKEEEIAKQDFREATGAVLALMPGEDPHRTAMGLNILQGSAGIRFRPVLRRMESDFIQEGAMLFFSNLQQFMPREEWIQVTGDDGKQRPMIVSPDMIQRKVVFIPTGVTETINKEAQVGQLLRFKELTVNDPTVNRQEINRRIADLMGFKDIDKLLTPMVNMSSGGLGPQEQQVIQQRLAEGASPDQIKEELLGPRPMDDVA